MCLFYDGEFRGLYLLTEKVEVNEGRVNVTDLEKANEKANPDVDDLTKLESKTGTTANGATYLYCDGMNDPADITAATCLKWTSPTAPWRKSAISSRRVASMSS